MRITSVLQKRKERHRVALSWSLIGNRVLEIGPSTSVEFNRESACPDAEGHCPQLGFDRSIKMPMANGRARVGPLELLEQDTERNGQNCQVLGEKGGMQERQKIKSTSHVRVPICGHWSPPQLGLG